MQRTCSLPALVSPGACHSPSTTQKGAGAGLGFTRRKDKSQTLSTFNELFGARHRSPCVGSNCEFFTRFGSAYPKVAQTDKLRKLEELLKELDENGNFEVSIEELQRASKLPKIRGAFANLGIQPHHSTLIHKAFDVDEDGKVTVDECVRGIEHAFHPDIEGCAGDLDVQMFKAAQWPKLIAGLPRTYEPPHQQERCFSVPEEQLYRAFVRTSAATALHSASALTQTRPFRAGRLAAY